MNKIYSFTISTLIIFICAISFNADENNYKPPQGYVPNAETAIRIALAVWEPIYGKEQIENEAPYKAELNNGVWTVTGSLPEGGAGGVAWIQIDKDSGCILMVIHGK